MSYFVLRESGGRLNRALLLYLQDKKGKISAPSQTVATERIAPKVCQGKPQHLAHNVPNFIQIALFSAEL